MMQESFIKKLLFPAYVLWVVLLLMNYRMAKEKPVKH